MAQANIIGEEKISPFGKYIGYVPEGKKERKNTWNEMNPKALHFHLLKNKKHWIVLVFNLIFILA